jgi:glycine cleavage system H protein
LISRPSRPILIPASPPEIIVANIPDNLLYTQDHEYIKKTEDPATVIVGITDYAQGELGDVVFVNLPKPGDKIGAHAVFGTIEAVKAVSELFSPVAGEVVAVNAALDGSPDLVNRDPYGEGWMIKLKVANPADLNGLLAPSAYRSQIGA